MYNKVSAALGETKSLHSSPDRDSLNGKTHSSSIMVWKAASKLWGGCALSCVCHRAGLLAGGSTVSEKAGGRWTGSSRACCGEDGGRVNTWTVKQGVTVKIREWKSTGKLLLYLYIDR